jgi:hypothetical protein
MSASATPKQASLNRNADADDWILVLRPVPHRGDGLELYARVRRMSTYDAACELQLHFKPSLPEGLRVPRLSGSTTSPFSVKP